MLKTVIHEVSEMGQSIWLDYISKDLISSGWLQQWIEKGVVGVTTNPSIFENAIAKTSDYDDEIHSLSRAGRQEQKFMKLLHFRKSERLQIYYAQYKKEQNQKTNMSVLK